VTVPDFDYTARPAARLEVPLAERIAAIRSRKAEERARAQAKTERRAASPAPGPARTTAKPAPKFVGSKRSGPGRRDDRRRPGKYGRSR
jgi:ATP-dependent RNA helicase RhlE